MLNKNQPDDTAKSLGPRRAALLAGICAAVIVIAACVMIFVQKPDAQNAAESTDLNALVAEEAASLLEADGEPTEVSITPELRRAFFDLGRDEFWQYLPVFTKNNPPQTPDAYLLQMFMRRPYESWPCEASADNSIIRPYITAEQLDDYAAVHFGAGGIQHGDDYYLKPFSYEDGKYFASPGSYVTAFYDLQALTILRDGDKIIYNAELNEYDLFTWLYYGNIGAVQDMPDDEYNRYYAEVKAMAENDDGQTALSYQSMAELALLNAYGSDIRNGKLTAEEACRQMIIDGAEHFGLPEQGYSKLYISFCLPASASDFDDVFYLQKETIIS